MDWVNPPQLDCIKPPGGCPQGTNPYSDSHFAFGTRTKPSSSIGCVPVRGWGERHDLFRRSKRCRFRLSKRCRVFRFGRAIGRRQGSPAPASSCGGISEARQECRGGDDVPCRALEQSRGEVPRIIGTIRRIPACRTHLLRLADTYELLAETCSKPPPRRYAAKDDDLASPSDGCIDGSGSRGSSPF